MPVHQLDVDTRGRAQRSAPTRNSSTGTSIRIGICQMDCGSFTARTSTRCRYTRADTAVRPYAEFIYENHHNHFVTSVTSRCAVECGVGGPQAGHSTDRWLQVRMHSAAGRAGTVHDGHFQHRKPQSKEPPSGMVDPHRQQTLPPSPAEPNIKQEFRNARRHRHAQDASTAQANTP